MADVVQDLSHDHAEINRLVLAVAAHLRGGDTSRARVFDPLVRLRDAVFLHFAREEEALFPFIGEIAPDLEPLIDRLLNAHDAVCGLIARLLHPSSNSPSLVVMFERFQVAYAAHASEESAFLAIVDSRLDAAQRDRLAALTAALDAEN